MYRLYVDESGDHTYTHLTTPERRYLCLLGCLFNLADYQGMFQARLELLKAKYFKHDPDEPVILHRTDLINKRGVFHVLHDPEQEQQFNQELIQLIRDTHFRLIAVVIDKQSHQNRYGPFAWHPYHYCLTTLLERYCGYLNHFNRCGDVLAESRGGSEDLQLKEAYKRIYGAGTIQREAAWFQRALTSHEIKLKPKSKNVAGLQLADLIAHPVKQEILVERGVIGLKPSFGQQICQALAPKYNRHVYSGEVEGYGKKFLE